MGLIKENRGGGVGYVVKGIAEGFMASVFVYQLIFFASTNLRTLSSGPGCEY